MPEQEYMHLQTRFHEEVADDQDQDRDQETEFENDMHLMKDVVEEPVQLTWRSWMVVLVTCFAQIAQVFITVAAGQITTFVARDLGDAALSGWIIRESFAW